jgi:hypothetical protein
MIQSYLERSDDDHTGPIAGRTLPIAWQWLTKRRNGTTWTAIIIYSKVRRTGVRHGTQRVIQNKWRGPVRGGSMNIEKLPDDKTNRLERNVAGKDANGPIIDDSGRLRPTD